MITAVHVQVTAFQASAKALKWGAGLRTMWEKGVVVRDDIRGWLIVPGFGSQDRV